MSTSFSRLHKFEDNHSVILPPCKTINIEVCDIAVWLFLQKVFDEAEMMAAAYRQKLSSILGIQRRKLPPEDMDQHDNGAGLYANWSWLEFESKIAQ